LATLLFGGVKKVVKQDISNMQISNLHLFAPSKLGGGGDGGTLQRERKREKEKERKRERERDLEREREPRNEWKSVFVSLESDALRDSIFSPNPVLYKSH
jgi:hypothetical protein